MIANFIFIITFSQFFFAQIMAITIEQLKAKLIDKLAATHVVGVFVSLISKKYLNIEFFSFFKKNVGNRRRF